MKIKIVILIATAVLIAAGCNQTVVEDTPPTADKSAMQKLKAIDVSDKATEALTQKDDGYEVPTTTSSDENATGQAQTASHGSYKVYSTEIIKAEAARHKIVLFFYADWCPFCVEADKQFKAQLNQIPPGVTVLKTNYDTESALKKKYVITYQHTFVQIDANGNLVSKWTGGDIENLKKYLR